MKFDDEELEFSIESNDDDTRVTLTLASPSGSKITMNQFIMELEMYLHEISKAESERIKTGAVNH